MHVYDSRAGKIVASGVVVGQLRKQCHNTHHA